MLWLPFSLTRVPTLSEPCVQNNPYTFCSCVMFPPSHWKPRFSPLLTEAPGQALSFCWRSPGTYCAPKFPQKYHQKWLLDHIHHQHHSPQSWQVVYHLAQRKCVPVPNCSLRVVPCKGYSWYSVPGDLPREETLQKYMDLCLKGPDSSKSGISLNLESRRHFFVVICDLYTEFPFFMYTGFVLSYVISLVLLCFLSPTTSSNLKVSFFYY